jgi:hypothetical protein
MKNGTVISGATSSSYATPAATTSDSGSQFTVMVKNSFGKALSNAATLSVLAQPTPTSSTTTLTTSNTTTSITSGTGTLVVTPLSLDFGSIMIGSSGTLAAQVSNSGTADVSIANVSISGAGFAVSGLSTGQTLAPAQSIRLDVTFAPVASGGVAGGIAVTSNATDSTLAISLSGTGVQPPVSHSVTLSWNPSTSVILGYNVYRGAVSGGPYTLQNTSLLASGSYVDNNVQSGSLYFYVATAVDGNNVESGYSSEISVPVP